jgi:hypothetical protein
MLTLEIAQCNNLEDTEVDILTRTGYMNCNEV